MKSFLILILLTIFTFNVKAQIISGYGLKLGLGISNQSWDYQANLSMDWKDKISISPRVYADFFNFSFFQLEAEAGYLQKGFKDKIPVTTMYQPDGTGEFISIDNSLDYLSISALAKFKYGLGIISPYIIAGPQFNLLLNKSISKGWEIVFDNFKKNNIGLSVGAGAELIKVLPISILIEYRYERDFNDNYNSPNIDIKNYSHVILLGIKF
jgi:opacity protein-like surface antigen